MIWSTPVASPVAARVRVRCGMLGLVLLSASCWSVSAQAQMQEAIAESLFEEGKQLFTDGKYPEACEKLAQSHKADPAGGTVLLLAMCYEREGRTASAWAKYSEAVSIARRDGREDRQQRAEEARAALENQLTYVRLVLSPDVMSLSGLELRLDGTSIPALTNTALPIDPGPHTLTVAAPGYVSHRQEFIGGKPTEIVELEVPRLSPVPVQPPPTSQPSPPKRALVSKAALAPEHHTSAVTTLAWIAGGLGVASVGVGGYFGYRAIKLDGRADDRCPSGTKDCDDAKGVKASQDALDKARISNIFVAAGAGALVGATIMFLVAPDEPTMVTTGIRVTPGGAMLDVSANY
jgi:hypothetical protein